LGQCRLNRSMWESSMLAPTVHKEGLQNHLVMTMSKFYIQDHTVNTEEWKIQQYQSAFWLCHRFRNQARCQEPSGTTATSTLKTIRKIISRRRQKTQLLTIHIQSGQYSVPQQFKFRYGSWMTTYSICLAGAVSNQGVRRKLHMLLIILEYIFCVHMIYSCQHIHLPHSLRQRKTH